MQVSTIRAGSTSIATKGLTHERNAGGRSQSYPSLSPPMIEEPRLRTCSSDLASQIQKPQCKSGARTRPAPKIITDSAVHLASNTSQASSPTSTLSQSPSEQNRPVTMAPFPFPTNGYANPVTHATARQAGYGGVPLQEQSAKISNGGYASSDLMDANPHCSISTDVDPGAEIRTKVFRMGAPLLRSTIPVSLGRAQTAASLGSSSARKQTIDDDCVEDEDVETVLSLSDAEFDDQGSLAVTLDFPC
mmetsp:Transcript_9797/g.15963  ORF Transcript_9797/g.15963 Transcript_9797/m.15963 type:complete len:247 (+) Transcript_9797:63-803(+)